MSFWIVILLGIIQGATEFLPVSSSGHLVLFYSIFGITQNTLLFSVLLHIATLTAVLYVYRKDVIRLVKNPFCKTNCLIITATLPTVILALLLKNVVEDSFGGASLITCFFITGIILLISDYISRKRSKKETLANNFLTQNNSSSKGRGFISTQTFSSPYITNIRISYKQAIIVGICQGFACFPGISRSGSTIASGLIFGIDKKESADFSFLLSIPIIFASLILEGVEFVKHPSLMPFSIIEILFGCFFAFTSGLLCVHLLLNLVKKQKLVWFSLYLFILGIFLILNKYLLFWF